MKQKKIGLALGGGGARAMFHLGVIDVLREEKIPLNQIVGTSMGAVIGAVAACGIDSQKVIDCLKKQVPKKPVSLWKINWSYTSLVKPADFENFLNCLFGDKLIEDCEIPFSCIAVDLESGKPFEIKEGPIAKAVRASSSLPLVLPPVYYMDRLLVDGGVLNNVPVDHLRSDLVDFTMAINLSSFKNRTALSAITFNQFIAPEKKKILPGSRKIKQVINSFKLMGETVLRSMEISSGLFTDEVLKKGHVDFLIEYELNYGLLEFDKSKEAAQKGREFMLRHVDELKKRSRKRSSKK